VPGAQIARDLVVVDYVDSYAEKKQQERKYRKSPSPITVQLARPSEPADKYQSTNNKGEPADFEDQFEHAYRHEITFVRWAGRPEYIAVRICRKPLKKN